MRIDYLGIVLLSVAVSLLLIWVTLAGDSFEWASVETVLMVGGSLVATALFIVVELRSKEPLIPLGLFRNRTFTLSVIASIATGIAMFGASVYLSQYMQLARGATPTEAGLMTIPMIAGLLLSSIGVGALITRFGQWKPYLIVGSVLLIAGSYLLSTIHYDTNFALVSLYMFLLGAGVGMTMQNLVLVVQNTSKPTEIGVASSGVTFFRSLGGTIGVSLMGAALATSVTNLLADAKDELMAAIVGLGRQGAEVADQLQTGTLPRSRRCPSLVRVIFEDIYAQGISHSFLIAVPFAIISLIAVIFLPNKPLTRMTTSERIQASEADFATVSVPEGMEVLTATATVRTSTSRTSIGRDGCFSRGIRAALMSIDMAELETSEARTDAVRALEAEFGELVTEFRRLLAENAHRVSPGMLPGEYKVFTTIVRLETTTISALAETLMADKGQISRTVRELEALGLVSRTPDPADGRSVLLSPTPEGIERLTAARHPREERARSTPSTSGPSPTSAGSPNCSTRSHAARPPDLRRPPRMRHPASLSTW